MTADHRGRTTQLTSDFDKFGEKTKRLPRRKNDGE